MKAWPNNPNFVKTPSIHMPNFKQYYPSEDDMDENQLVFYKYWVKEWKARRPRHADLSFIFTYVYKVIRRGVSNKKDLNDILTEIDALMNCYPGKVVDYLKYWKLDLLLYYDRYEDALEFLIEEKKKKNKVWGLNSLLNLKILLGYQMDGCDLLHFAESLGLRLYKSTIEHLGEAYDYCHKILFDFKREEGEEILIFISNRFDYERRQAIDPCSGIVFSKTEIREGDSLTVKTTFPEQKALKDKWFNFYKIAFFVEFALRNVDTVNKEIKYKYQKKKSKKVKQPLLPKLSLRIWNLKVHEAFINPSLNQGGDDCAHEQIELCNHWETYRKYQCVRCFKTFMCACERELVEKVKPHKKKGDWIHGICPKCRGLNDASPITSGKLMYGSTFYAQHWREINFERDKMAIDIANKEEKNPWEVSLALLSSHEPENRVRKRYGIPLVGEGWISETALYKTIKKIFPNHEVIHHGTPNWLGSMHLDVYIPELKIAFEYQGRQHFEAIEYFGGKDGLERLKERDRKKFELCEENGIRLFYINEGQDFSEEILRDILKEYID